LGPALVVLLTTFPIAHADATDVHVEAGGKRRRTVEFRSR
jgi:hypothetical protein